MADEDIEFLELLQVKGKKLGECHAKDLVSFIEFYQRLLVQFAEETIGREAVAKSRRDWIAEMLKDIQSQAHE